MKNIQAEKSLISFSSLWFVQNNDAINLTVEICMKNGLFEEGRSLADISLRADKSADKIWSALMFLLFVGTKSSVRITIYISWMQCNAMQTCTFYIYFGAIPCWSLFFLHLLATIHSIYFFASRACHSSAYNSLDCLLCLYVNIYT